MTWDSTINLAGVEAALTAAALQAADTAAEYVLAQSTTQVPIEEGTLSRSGKASAALVAGMPTGVVSYNTPYAVRQHEDLSLRHDDGRSAKYLERPLTAAAPVVARLAREHLARAMR